MRFLYSPRVSDRDRETELCQPKGHNFIHNSSSFHFGAQQQQQQWLSGSVSFPSRPPGSTLGTKPKKTQKYFSFYVIAAAGSDFLSCFFFLSLPSLRLGLIRLRTASSSTGHWNLECSYYIVLKTYIFRERELGGSYIIETIQRKQVGWSSMSEKMLTV